MQEKTDILTALSSKVEAAAIQGGAIQKSKAPAGHKQTSQQCSNQHKRLSTKKKHKKQNKVIN